MERINARKMNTINIVQCYFKCQRSINNLIFVLSCREIAHDGKEFSHENSKPRRESRITTCWATRVKLEQTFTYSKSTSETL